MSGKRHGEGADGIDEDDGADPEDVEDSDDEDDEQDERIMEIMTYSGRHTPAEIADKMKALGGDDAIIYNEMFPSKPRHAMAHFLILGVGNFDEDAALAPQIAEKKEVFQKCLPESDDQAAMLLMLELYVIKEFRAAMEEYGDILKVLWENDIVAEDAIVAWHENENALQHFWPAFFDLDDAINIRDNAKDFVGWVQAGED
mmetsp:Transcript_41692/g.89512  ORF Transcript_41692/g.89512 Transcript_41692/m.89512 type:complete len:201 (-) Transcript_41692:74-676(-)